MSIYLACAFIGVALRRLTGRPTDRSSFRVRAPAAPISVIGEARWSVGEGKKKLCSHSPLPLFYKVQIVDCGFASGK